MRKVKVSQKKWFGSKKEGGWVVHECSVIFSLAGNPSEITDNYFYPAKLSLKVRCKTE